MNRDQVWEEIKNDNSKMYGQTMLDVFLQLIDDIEENHFFELSQKQIDSLSSGSIANLLYKSTNIQEVSKLLGRKGFNKLEENQVRYLVSPKDYGESHTALLINNRRKDIIIAILQYKEITSSVIFNIISSARNSNDLEQILGYIGQENLSKIESPKIAYLLSNFLNKFGSFGSDEGFAMFKILAQRLGENINKLESRHLAWVGTSSAERLINRVNSGIGYRTKELIPDANSSNKEYLEEILEILGPKNLNKLTGGQINMLLDTEDIDYRKRLSRILGERLDKLSNKVISAMIYGPFINNLDLYNAVDVADSLGPNRMAKWLKSNESQETIELMKEKVNETSSTAHDWEDNFNAFMKWIEENIAN